MAIGDVIIDSASVNAGADMDFQPASGVEIMITQGASDTWAGAAPYQTPAMRIQLTDGTDVVTIAQDTNAANWNGLKLFINNTNYLRLSNDYGGTEVFGYTGLQTNS